MNMSQKKIAPVLESESLLRLELVRQEGGGAGLVGEVPSNDGEPANETAFLVERNGARFAGSQLIMDLYGASNLDDIVLLEKTLRECVDAAGETLVHVNVQPFGSSGHIGAIAVLSESQLSVHAWPEQKFAAIDIFTRGKTRPERCIEILLSAFNPQRLVIEEALRGRARG